MNSFKKFLSIILCATSILSAPVNTFATGDSDLPNEKLAEDNDILSLSDEKLNNETENTVNEKLEAFEEILKKAFDENNESAILSQFSIKTICTKLIMKIRLKLLRACSMFQYQQIQK